MPRRLPETLADYLVVAICPTLIALFVGSFMFFLVEVFYQGEFKLRLMWVMAMFVMAIVCIARIAMEEGWSYATLYALPLALAVGVALAKFVPINPLGNWLLMALVWWSAHKLTWDCTLVDDSQDASGEGLLQQMGLEHSAGAAAALPPGTTAPASPAEPEATTNTSRDQRPLAWWEKLIEPDRRPHAPGVWVIYYSLAALPIFGVGGWFVSAGQPEARWAVFRLLVLFVACGMALLLATSFLGLRRYLRQRRIEMPLDMTATWITVGVALILATLLVAAILPRPTAEYSLSQLPLRITSAVRKASRFAVGPEGTQDTSNPEAATTEAREGQKTDRTGDDKTGENDSSGKGQPSDQGGKGESDKSKAEAGGGDQPGKGGGESKQQSNDASGDSKSGQAMRGERNNNRGDASSGERQLESSSQKSDAQQSQSDSQAESQPSAADNSASSSLTNLAERVASAVGSSLRWLFYAILLIAGLALAIVYRQELWAAWNKLLAELRELWAGWFRSKQPEGGTAEVAPRVMAARPFAAFADPFASGEAARMSWPELVRYTFAAVEAFGREHDCPRQADQTPHEFAQAVARTEQRLAAPVQALAASYSQLAYAPRSGARGASKPLQALWREMRQTHATGPPVTSATP